MQKGEKSNKTTITKLHKGVMNVLKELWQEEQQQMRFLQEQLRTDLICCEEPEVYNARMKRYLKDVKEMSKKYQKKLSEVLEKQIKD